VKIVMAENTDIQTISNSTRRKFLRNAALGAVGVALVAGGAANILSPLRVAAATQGTHETLNSPTLSESAEQEEFFANAGTTFILVPVPNTSPQEFTHTVDGVVQTSRLGDCTVHFDLVVTATGSSSRPYLVKGKQTITTAEGASSVTSSVNGYLSSNPANATFLGIHYKLTFTSGTGRLTDARGRTDLYGFAAIATAPGHEDFPGSKSVSPQSADLIAPPSGDLTGKACWIMHGRLELPGGD
jgi:hypothetical protein